VSGGINYPFASNPVYSSYTNITLKPLIEASSNTVIIYSILDDSEDVYGAYSVLGSAIRDILPANNLINSTFSFCNNKVEISSFTTIDDICGAYLYLDTMDDATNPVTFNSSIYLDNNYILFNSSAIVDDDACAAYLNLYQDHGAIYNLANVSLSNNTVEIKDTLSDGGIYAAYLRFNGGTSHVENLSHNQ
jgi:hypothetical protein